MCYGMLENVVFYIIIFTLQNEISKAFVLKLSADSTPLIDSPYTSNKPETVHFHIPLTILIFIILKSCCVTVGLRFTLVILLRAYNILNRNNS